MRIRYLAAGIAAALLFVAPHILLFALATWAIGIVFYQLLAERQKRWEEQVANQQRRDAMGWYGERFMAALIEIRDGHNDPRARAAEALEGCSYAKEPNQ